MNTDGSFECSCSTEGYQLSEDGLTCQGNRGVARILIGRRQKTRCENFA